MALLPENHTNASVNDPFSYASSNVSATNATVVNINWTAESILIVALLPPIFLISLLGNIFVIITICTNSRMRSVTYTFLLNLAVSDLLLSIFCMPKKFASIVLQRFFFGTVMCKIITYLQLTATASAYTLVSLAVERYFAICHPLNSMKWQTQSHAVKLICGIWCFAFASQIPVAVFAKHQTTDTGAEICRAIWPSGVASLLNVIALDLEIMIIPFVVISGFYCAIVRVLLRAVRRDKRSGSVRTQNVSMDSTSTIESPRRLSIIASPEMPPIQESPRNIQKIFTESGHFSKRRQKIAAFGQGRRKNSSVVEHPDDSFRRSRTDRRLVASKRAITLLSLIVVEFFICWIPICCLYTLTEFHLVPSTPGSSLAKTIAVLLCFCSTITNPITYCFINQQFREAALSAILCRCRKRKSHFNNGNQGLAMRKQSSTTDTTDSQKLYSSRTASVTSVC